MRDGAQAFFGDQFTGAAANTVSLVFDTHQRGFELFDKLFLAGR
jgi:hypothetical protein